jgi:tetratricopeptide (TPR) repeat protein
MVEGQRKRVSDGDEGQMVQAQAMADEAAHLIETGRAEEGLEQIGRAVELVDGAGSDELRALYRVRKAVLQIRADRAEAGLGSMNEALELAQETANARLIDETRSRRALALAELGRVNEGLDELNAVLADSEARGDQEQIYRVLGLLGDAYRMAADEEHSEASYRRAIEIAESMEPAIDASGVRLGLGQALMAAGRPGDAVQALLPALSSAKEGGNAASERKLLTHLSDAYMRLDRRQDLVSTTERLLELAETANDHRAAITHRENLITLLLGLDRPQEALPQIEEALAYARRRGPRERVLVHLMSLGRVQFDLGEMVGAEEAYKEALGLAEDQENLRAVTTILGRLGALYAETDDLDAALRFGELAVTKAGEVHDSAIVAEQSILMAMTYRDLGRANDALQAASRARQAYQSLGKSALADRAATFVQEIEAEAAREA